MAIFIACLRNIISFGYAGIKTHIGIGVQNVVKFPQPISMDIVLRTDATEL